MANRPKAFSDADGQQTVLAVIDDTTDAINPAYSSVVINLADLTSGGTVRQARFRWVYFKDAKNNCAPMKMLVLCTPPEPDA